MKKQKNYKPFYKSLLLIKENLYSSNKVLNFKKEKWLNSSLVRALNKQIYINKFFNLFDNSIYYKSNYFVYYDKNYKTNLLRKKKISKFYGFLTLKFFKKVNLNSNKNFLNQKFKYKFDKYFMCRLENKLDSIVYKSYFTESIKEARNLINQGYVYVNKIKIIKSSFIVKKGDLITFDNNIFLALECNICDLNGKKISRSIPNFLEINYKTFQILISESPISEKFVDVSNFRLDFNKLSKFLYTY